MSDKTQPDDFGKPIGMSQGPSRWFNEDPKITESPVRPVRQSWMCPLPNCGGEMIFNGSTWPMNPPGYHHTCTICKFTAAVHEEFPRIGFRDE